MKREPHLGCTKGCHVDATSVAFLFRRACKSVCNRVSAAIDRVWHEHLLFTGAYRENPPATDGMARYTFSSAIAVMLKVR